MKFCFCSIMDNDEKEIILNSKIKPTLSTSSFNKKLAKGFNFSLKEDLFVISTSSVASYPNYYKIFISQKKYFLNKINCISMQFINLPLLKYITEYTNIYKELFMWYKRNNDPEKVIFSYGRRPTYVFAISRFKKKHPDVKTAMMFGDLYGNLKSETTCGNSFKKKLVNRLLKQSIKLALGFDACVFMTEQMNTILNNNKPYLIIEGLCETKIVEQNIRDEKLISSKLIKIIYTGVISKQYNVDILVDAVASLDSKKYLLLLYGDGPWVNEVKEMRYKNVKYMGCVDSDKIKTIQYNADILVNPRQNIEEFTKYSFPSKILEYLSTGNPVIAYKLDGVPEEYDSFLYYVEDNTIANLAKKIEEVGKLSLNEKKIYKTRVLEFLLKNKTEEKQCKRIIKFLGDI